MTDYIDRLVARSLSVASLVRPRIPSIFETQVPQMGNTVDYLSGFERPLQAHQEIREASATVSSTESDESHPVAKQHFYSAPRTNIMRHKPVLVREPQEFSAKRNEDRQSYSSQDDSGQNRNNESLELQSSPQQSNPQPSKSRTIEQQMGLNPDQPIFHSTSIPSKPIPVSPIPAAPRSPEQPDASSNMDDGSTRKEISRSHEGYFPETKKTDPKPSESETTEAQQTDHDTGLNRGWTRLPSERRGSEKQVEGKKEIQSREIKNMLMQSLSLQSQLAEAFRYSVQPSGRSNPESDAEANIQVTIGRVEVRAASEHAVPARQRPLPHASGLEEYLKKPRRGGR